MDCCSSTTDTTEPEYNAEIDQSSNRLAILLVQTPEYQEFIRLAQLINLDPGVRRISMEIRQSQMNYSGADEKPIEVLQSELESLPAVQTYRKAEAAVRDLLHSVDQVISAAAGVEFAANALPKGCG